MFPISSKHRDARLQRKSIETSDDLFRGWGVGVQDIGNFDEKISDLFLIYLFYSFRIAEVYHFF